MSAKLIKLKNKLVPVINRIPLAKKISTPPYRVTKKAYNKLVRRKPVPLQGNSVTDDKALATYYINHYLVARQAEHLARIHNRKTLYYEPEVSGSYIPAKLDPRLVAVYLPQFHKVPLNESAWGKGFTEWTNVASASAGFVGQQQPILPADLGFYDLDRPEKIKEQIDLAKKYGIHGFMFYYYWFSGEKILDVPINTFLENKSWDFNFMICWANENWTKRWDGMDNEIIIGQKYNEDDPIKFIKDVAPILNDERYMTIDGKRPILAVYRPSTIINIDEYAKIWREYFRDTYNKELYLIVGNNHTDSDPREYDFDALYDFSPGSVIWGGSASEVANIKEEDYSGLKLDPNFFGSVVDYRSIALNEKIDADQRYQFPSFQAVMPHWDNHARKKGKHTHALINSTPEVYASWLDRILTKATKKEKSPIVFLNAWNEWAEGAMLEPTIHLGHANLLRTAEVLSKYSNNSNNKKIFPYLATTKKNSTKIAVVIHLYYPEMWHSLTDLLTNINQNFDIYVTVPEKHKDLKLRYKDHEVVIVPTPNVGRDILPFLHVLRKIQAAGYEYVLKLHSKKSKHISRQNAAYWLRASVNSLLASEKSVDDVISKLSKSTKIIGPKEFAVALTVEGEPSLKSRVFKYYEQKVAKDILKNINKFVFSAGSMFWARVDAFDEILDRHIMSDDFELEQGQLWNTLAHYLERDFWINVQNRYGHKAVSFCSAGGEISELNSVADISKDLGLIKSIDSLDKSKYYSIDKNTKISIIITNYNYGRYLEDAIKSALKQTYANVELHIVDDGSTDGLSLDIIAKYTKKHPNKVYGHLLHHKGIVEVRNFSLGVANGDYIIFLDADDLIPKEYVDRMLEEAAYGDFDVVYSDMHNFGEDFQVSVMPEFDPTKMAETNIVNMSALIKKSSIGDLKFDDYLSGRKLEDWDFFLGLMYSGAKFSKTNSTFLQYRVHTGQRNNNLNRDQTFWDEHNKTVKYINSKYDRLYPDRKIGSIEL